MNTPLNPDALAQLIMWKELPFGGNPDNYIRLDANAAHKVIELLKAHLAFAQPEVNTVEELDQLPVGTLVWLGESQFYKLAYEEYPWVRPYGYERFASAYLAKYSVEVVSRPEVPGA